MAKAPEVNAPARRTVRLLGNVFAMKVVMESGNRTAAPMKFKAFPAMVTSV